MGERVDCEGMMPKFVTKKNLEYLALNRQINLLVDELKKMNVDVEETIKDLEMRQMSEMVEFLTHVRDETKAMVNS